MSDSAPLKTFKFKLEWSVPRTAFDTPEGSHQFIKSEEFRACPASKSCWELRLYPRSDTDMNLNYVSLYLGRLGSPERKANDPVHIKHRAGIIIDGVETKISTWDVAFPKDDAPFPEWGWMQFISRNELFDRNYFRDDQLTIFCDTEVYWIPEVEVPEPTLTNDWSKLLDSGKFSDVVLVVGGEELKAHKVVLSARSPVFEAMFTHNMRENQTGRVEIKDLDVIAVKALLSFIYSGEVKDLEAIAEKLLPAADKYGMDRLKILCEKEILRKELSIENVMDVLSFAELHSVDKLKARALRFINKNAVEVLKQDSFWELAKSNQDLVRGAFAEEVTEQDCDGPEAKRRKLN